MDSGPVASGRQLPTEGASRNDEWKVLPISIRLRQAQHFLGNKTENELRADRRDARDQGFAQIALDMKFFGIAEAAMGHHALFAGVKPGLSGEIFCGIAPRPPPPTPVTSPPALD